MRVAVRVQHSPARDHLLSSLLRDFGRFKHVETIAHQSDPPSPWLGYKLCLRDLPDCTHVLVVQSDAKPCRNFAPAVEQIAAANPDTPVCLFISKVQRDSRAVTQAMQNNQRYATLNPKANSFVPVVAVLWPRAKAVEFMDWADVNPGLPGQREPRSDDAMVGRWKTIRRETVRVTVPSLVEHLVAEPSVVGNDKKGGRVAMFLAEDALEYDWSSV